VKARDRDDFADMLVDLAGACGPKLAIMDSVVAMEGAGPSSGVPRHVGALIASPDCVALDVVASAVAGFGPMDVYTVRAANRRGGPGSPEDVDVVGVPWRELAVPDFAHPVADPTSRMPWRLARWARHVLVARPVLECPSGCTSCGTCVKECPVEAIAMRDRRPSFDYDLCIRCYCCQELCPQHVIGLKRTRLARWLEGSRR
jgi:ferredoxin